jgi:hypothetical protein
MVACINLIGDKHYQTHANMWVGKSLLSPWVYDTIKLHFLSMRKTTIFEINRMAQRGRWRLGITSLNSHFHSSRFKERYGRWIILKKLPK